MKTTYKILPETDGITRIRQSRKIHIGNNIYNETRVIEIGENWVKAPHRWSCRLAQ